MNHDRSEPLVIFAVAPVSVPSVVTKAPCAFALHLNDLLELLRRKDLLHFHRACNSVLDHLLVLLRHLVGMSIERGAI